MGAVIIPFLLLAGAVIAWTIYANHKRKQMWRDLAARYGLHYDSGDPLDLMNRHAFALFQQGHSRRVKNTLHGAVDGMEVALFDYQYTTGSGKNQHTHHYSALMAELPCSGQLHIRPESFFDRIFSIFGWDDINFEFEQFNRAFRVTGPDKKFAYDICHSAMMEFLLEKEDHCWEIQGNQLLLYSDWLGTFDADEVERCLRDARGFRERLPSYLLQP